jgi:hypothetical protein
VRKLLILLIALSLGALGLLFFLGTDSPTPVLGETSLSANTSQPTRSGSSLEKQDIDSTHSTARTPSTTPHNTSHTPTPPNSHLAEVKGRCFHPTSSSTSAITVELHGLPANPERLIRHGEPEHWEDPAAVIDADGRFSIRFDPPLAYQFTLTLSAHGCAKALWRWNEIRAGELKDVGDVHLLAGGSIAGRVVDARGNVLTQGWTVRAESSVVPSEHGRDGGRDSTHGSAQVDPTSGEFRIDGLPAGDAKLTATSTMSDSIDGPVVDVRAGDVVRVDLRFEGADISKRITVTLHSQPFTPFVLTGVQGLTLRGPGIGARIPGSVVDAPQSFRFDDLPPGLYTVEVNDRRFQTWTKNDVAPGTSLDVELKGSASVRLSVVDAKSGAAVVPSTVRVLFEKVNFLPREFSILERGKSAPAGGLFDGLIPIDQTLIISADGYADREVSIQGVQPNDVIAVKVEMRRGLRLAGRVVLGAARSPAAGAEVELIDVADANASNRLARDGDSTHMRVGGADSSAQSGSSSNAASSSGNPSTTRFSSELSRTNVTRTDASGRFVFASVTAGPQVVRASYNAFVAVQETVDVSGGAEKLDLVLVLPESSYLSGRIRGPEGVSFGGYALLVTPANQDVRDVRQAILSAGEQRLGAPIAADGTFRAGPFSIGEARVSLRLPGVILPSEYGNAKTLRGETIDLGRVTFLAGKDTQQDFDLRTTFPGFIEVELHVNGRATPDWLVEIRRTEDLASIAGAAFTDSTPTAKSNPLPCASYRLLARAVDGSWAYLAPQTITVKPGETATTSIDAPLVDGELQMNDENGSPVSMVRLVTIVSDASDLQKSLGGVRLSTTSEGKLGVRLATGSYRLYDGHGPITRDTVTARFEMTASGPVPAALEIPR